MRQPLLYARYEFQSQDLYEGGETFSLQKYPHLWASDVSLSNCFDHYMKLACNRSLRTFHGAKDARLDIRVQALQYMNEAIRKSRHPAQ